MTRLIRIVLVSALIGVLSVSVAWAGAGLAPVPVSPDDLVPLAETATADTSWAGPGKPTAAPGAPAAPGTVTPREPGTGVRPASAPTRASRTPIGRVCSTRAWRSASAASVCTS
jgi:hypothetical protein